MMNYSAIGWAGHISSNPHLFTLARQGLAFPRLDTFKSAAPVAVKPQSFPTVRVRVIRPFYGLRRLLEVGEVVSLLEPDALDALALGRVARA